jgi:hypothetical protein
MEAGMTKDPLEVPMVFAGPGDSIRVVPLFVPEEVTQLATGALPPKLTYRGGRLLTSAQVFTVFWGRPWEQAPETDLVTKLNQYFNYILASPLIDQLGEYSVPGNTIGHGKYIGTATVVKPTPGHIITDLGIRHMLQQEIGTNAGFPHPTSNTLYFVFLPPGVSVSQGGARSCQAFCGYHNHSGAQIFYAVMPYPGCKGCAGGLAPFDALTSTSSHELCEAITDPIPGQGWYDDHNGEIGDICAWKTKKVGAYSVQLEWSNKANTCL